MSLQELLSGLLERVHCHGCDDYCCEQTPDALANFANSGNECSPAVSEFHAAITEWLKDRLMT